MTVGTILTLVNQWGALTGARSDDVLWLRILANYVVPFVVSNLGAAASYTTEKKK
jgi:hypothetical protein